MSRRSKYFKEKKYTVLKEIVKKKCKKTHNDNML